MKNKKVLENINSVKKKISKVSAESLFYYDRGAYNTHLKQ